MYNVDDLQRAICSLYEDGVIMNEYSQEDVDSMLNRIDCEDLLQVIRHHADTVFDYACETDLTDALRFRGRELFNQRATLVFTVLDDAKMDSGVYTEISHELWLLENMEFIAVSCFSLRVHTDMSMLVTERRSICGEDGDPWDSDLYFTLEELTDHLVRMANSYTEDNLPTYEL